MLKIIFISVVALACLVAGLLYFFIYRHVGYKIIDSKVVYVSWNEGNGFQELPMKADSASFSKIDDKYGKDKSSVFFVGRLIEGADPLTFERISVDKSQVEDVYGKDKNHVFKFSEILPGVNPATFVPKNENLD